MVPSLDVRGDGFRTSFELPTRAPSPAKRNWSNMQQVMDLIPYQMFLLATDFSDCFENHAAARYFGPFAGYSVWSRILEFTHPDDAQHRRRGVLCRQ
jgi:type IV secretory pathway protease TraF